MLKQGVPYFDVSAQNAPIKHEILQAVERVIDNGSFILGPEVEAFEKSFAQYHDVKHCIAVNSGTSALHLALMSMGIGPGDEVITTPMTFAASAWAISYVGATPVFVDIDPITFNIDPDHVAANITSNTRAIIPVHLYGHPCDMDPLVELCDQHRIFLLEDAAQAHGARYFDQKVGTFGHMGAFSFYPTKNLGSCGEAGAIITDDDEFADAARLLRNHGSRERYKYEEVGYNYRMEGLQGAILNIKLNHLDDWNLDRQRIAMKYHSLLSSVDEITLPSQADYAEHVYHLYSIRAKNRSALVEFLNENSIGHSTHYAVPMHLQECYQYLGYKDADLPHSLNATQEVLNLPIFPGMSDAQIEQVADTIKAFYS